MLTLGWTFAHEGKKTLRNFEYVENLMLWGTTESGWFHINIFNFSTYKMTHFYVQFDVTFF